MIAIFAKIIFIIFLAFIEAKPQVSANVSSQFRSPTLFQPVNLDFEDGDEATLPVGWELPGYAEKAGYKAWLTQLEAIQGKYCLELFHPGPFIDGMYGAVSQGVDATPFLGKRIKIRAAIRAEISSPKGSAHLWVHEHLVGDQSGLFELMNDKPIVINKWEYYEIEGKIDDYAEYINFGLMLKGTGRAWIDNISIEILDIDSSYWEKPRQLIKQELINLKAFSRLYGIVRYFHPSFESQKNDWERFLLTGVEYVSNAENNDELRQRLLKLFKPISPAIDIIIRKKSEGSIKPKQLKPEEPPPDALKNVCIGWMQYFAGWMHEKEKFSSKVVNIYKSRRERDGTVIQTINVDSLKGKKVRLSAAVRIEQAGPESQAQLWLRTDTERQKTEQIKFMDDFTITSNKWKVYSTELDVSNEAVNLHIVLVLIGDGKAWFDDVKLDILENGKVISTIQPRNYDFEYGNVGQYVRSWIMPPNIMKSGYNSLITDYTPFRGKQCLLIESDTLDRIVMPKPGEKVTTELADDLYAIVPLTCFVDSLRTLPLPDTSLGLINSTKPENFIMSGNDRVSRIAITIITWNIIRQFSLEKINPKILDNALTKSLLKASTDKNEFDFLRTLEQLISFLDDGQARVWLRNEQPRFGLPVLLRWINNKLLITKKENNLNNVNISDEIISINDIKTEDFLKDYESLISGASLDWKRTRAIAAFRAGGQNSVVRLGIKDKDNKSKFVELARNIVLNELNEDRPEKFSELKPGIFYIDMTRITDEEFKKNILDKILNARGIIFDARGNSLLSEHILGLIASKPLESFTWKIPIYTKPEHLQISYKTIKSRIELTSKQLHSKIVFLSDERSIGYTESILELVRYYNLGEIVGKPTAGTSGEIIPIRLGAGYNLSMTSIIGFNPAGIYMFGKSVEPTYKVEYNIRDWNENKYDSLIKKALSILED